MKNKKYKWFTLVELIIVITILAILATIAFISFQWYSKNARDWNRLSTMKNIESWLRLYYTKNSTYPEVESWTIIQSWSTQLWTQWYLWENASRLIWFSKIPVDPDDWSKYVYSVNKLKNKFQVLWYLEKSDYVLTLNKTYALNYSNRIPKTFWDDLWIILDSNNNSIGWPSIDITNKTWDFKVIFNGSEELAWTWIILKWLKSTYESWKLSWQFYDPNCDLPDVVIWNQVWAWCNSTLWNGIEWPSNGTCRNYSWTITATDCSNTEYMASNKKEKSWSVASWVNWTVDNIWGKFYTWNNSSSACNNWRHVPTIKEWETLEKYIWNNLIWNVWDCNTTVNWYQCTWLWWKNNYLNNNNIVSILQIPLGGAGTSASFLARWQVTRLWSSSSESWGAYRVYFSYDHDDLTHYLDSSINNYYSVRCIKD